jgi:nitrate reductase NapD
MEKPKMNISGVIVHASQEKFDQVHTLLKQTPGVDVHAAGADGKMVVTIEKTNDRETADTFDEIGKIPGVLATAMVYHHFEPNAEEIS